MGLDELQESLSLIFTEDSTTTRICIYLSRREYEVYDQKRIDMFANANNLVSFTVKSKPYPLSLSTKAPSSIMTYISSVLAWIGKEYLETFRVGTKEELKRPLVDVNNIPAIITSENSEALYNSMITSYRDLDIFNKKRFEVPLSSCYTAPGYIKCRGFEPEHATNLANSYLALSPLIFNRKTIYLYPLIADDKNEDGKIPYSRPPTQEEIGKSNFWVLGGQHTVAAYRKMMNNSLCDADQKRQIKNVDGVMYWAPPMNAGNLKLMGLSNALNMENSATIKESQFLVIAKQIRDLWKHHGHPNNHSSSTREKNYKDFYAFVRIVYLGAFGKQGMRLMEFSPFIFTMSNETFELYMQVLEASRVGELVAFNGCTQREVVDRSKDWTAWQLKKRNLRDL
ncbi:unnamed protein product [Calypogeia fissa]